LPSLFNSTPLSIIPNTRGQDAIGKYLRGAWAAFANDPVNGLGAYDDWPTYERHNETLIRLAYNDMTGINLTAGNHYDKPCRIGGPGGPGQPRFGTNASAVTTGSTSLPALTPRSTNAACEAVLPGSLAVVVGFLVASYLT
jgi:hypothetical protein